MGERWLPIKSCRNRYEVSDCGRVRSLFVRNSPKRLLDEPLILRTVLNQGYDAVSIRHNGKKKLIRVYRLILEAFSGPPNGRVARHLDGNQRNDHLSNLRWGTPQDNSDDMKRHGNSARGERNTASKLKPRDILEIRRRAAAGEERSSIGADFGIRADTVSRIFHGRRWGHISRGRAP